MTDITILVFERLSEVILFTKYINISLIEVNCFESLL
jgi:hypothetical protein